MQSPASAAGKRKEFALMASSTPSAHPVRSLREQVTALEAGDHALRGRTECTPCPPVTHDDPAY